MYDDGEYEVPDCSGDSCAFSNDRGKAYGVVDLRRSLTVSSDFYYYGLGAQFWIQQDRLGGPERYADLLKQWGFDTDTGIDLSSEQSGRIPSPAWLAEYCEDVGCVDGADSWRTGNNVNMAIGQGDVLLTPLQLASGYATIGNGGTVWQPHVVKEVRDGVTKELKRTIEPKALNQIEHPARVAAGALRRAHRRHHQRRRHRRRRLQRVPARHLPHRRQDRHRPGARRGGANKAPTAVFGAYGPATDAQYAISVLLEEAGYGGSVAAPVARRLFDVLRDPLPSPAGARGWAVRGARRPSPRAPGTCATDGRSLTTTTFSTRERVAPGALGRLSRNPAAPWRHIDLVLVGCILAVAALGSLMIFSATRGRDPSDFDTSFLAKQVLFIGVGSRAHARGRDGRLPALPGGGPDPLRRRAPRPAHGRHRPRQRAQGQPGVVPGRAVPAPAERVRQDHRDHHAGVADRALQLRARRRAAWPWCWRSPASRWP